RPEAMASFALALRAELCLARFAQEPERLHYRVDEIVTRALGGDLALADHHLRPLPLRRHSAAARRAGAGELHAEFLLAGQPHDLLRHADAAGVRLARCSSRAPCA